MIRPERIPTNNCRSHRFLLWKLQHGLKYRQGKVVFHFHLVLHLCPPLCPPYNFLPVLSDEVVRRLIAFLEQKQREVASEAELASFVHREWTHRLTASCKWSPPLFPAFPECTVMGVKRAVWPFKYECCAFFQNQDSLQWERSYMWPQGGTSSADNAGLHLLKTTEDEIQAVPAEWMWVTGDLSRWTQPASQWKLQSASAPHDLEQNRWMDVGFMPADTSFSCTQHHKWWSYSTAVCHSTGVLLSCFHLSHNICWVNPKESQLWPEGSRLLFFSWFCSSQSLLLSPDITGSEVWHPDVDTDASAMDLV